MLRWLLTGMLCLLGAEVSFAASAKRVVKVDGPRLTLGMIVPRINPEYSGLDLGAAPRPGQSETISRRDFYARLDNALVPRKGIRAPKVIKVKRSAQRLHEAKLEAMVRRELLRNGLQGLEIVSVDIKGGMKVGGGDVKLRIKRSRRMRPGRQLVRFFVRAGQDQETASTASVVLRRVAGGSMTSFERGQQVRVIVDTGSIVVSTFGIAQEDGRIGQQVRVLPSRGMKVITGVVQEDGTVEVSP
jgi:flagella basal body P-ring formation protein FlgA